MSGITNLDGNRVLKYTCLAQRSNVRDMRRFPPIGEPYRYVAFSQDGRVLTVGRDGAFILIWDAQVID